MHEPAPGPPLADRTRDRAALLNQLMLAGVVVVLTFLILRGDFPGDIGLFFAGALGVFAMTVVVLLVPWDRVPSPWLLAIPAVDILAIGAMRFSDGAAGLGLLWLFPAMWLAADFGVLGIAFGMFATMALFAIALAHDPARVVSSSTLLLPLTILAVSVVTYLTSRRSAAQRTLLNAQAEVLGHALERTRRQEQELTEVLDAVDFGVVRISPDGAVAVINEAQGRLQRPGEADPETYRADGTTPLAPDELPLARALRGEAFDNELVWVGPPEGPRRALSITARRLTSTDGADAGAVVVSSDVTAEMAALSARDELVASVSHELRTPLTSILGYLDLVLEDRDLPHEARRNVQVAERNAERLLGIIGDVLAASQRTHDANTQLHLVRADIDVADIVRSTVESLRLRAMQRDIVLDIDGVRSVHAHADGERLRQVLDNLVANSIAYNKHGGDVVLTAERLGTDVQITVRDTGIGLVPADLPQLFQRFYRGQAARDARVSGTGLGLAISRDIVRAHGGDILVESTPGEGTMFTVLLPQGHSEEGRDDVA